MGFGGKGVLEAAIHRLKRHRGRGFKSFLRLSGRKERVCLTATGVLPAWCTGVLLTGTGLGDRSTGTLCSPGTHRPADQCSLLMTECGTEQVNHEAVMGAKCLVLAPLPL